VVDGSRDDTTMGSGADTALKFNNSYLNDSFTMHSNMGGE
jgi:hypothetical protein